MNIGRLGQTKGRMEWKGAVEGTGAEDNRGGMRDWGCEGKGDWVGKRLRGARGGGVGGGGGG